MYQLANHCRRPPLQPASIMHSTAGSDLKMQGVRLLSAALRAPVRALSLPARSLFTACTCGPLRVSEIGAAGNVPLLRVVAPGQSGVSVVSLKLVVSVCGSTV